MLAISAGTRDSLVAAGLPADMVSVVPNALRTDRIRFTAAGRAATRERLGIVRCLRRRLHLRFHPRKRNDVLVDAVVRSAPGSS